MVTKYRRCAIIHVAEREFIVMYDGHLIDDESFRTLFAAKDFIDALLKGI